MEFIEIFPDPPLPTYLSIPIDAKSILPERRLSVVEFLQFKFPNPFHQAPLNQTGITIWSDSPPQDIQVNLLLGCAVPQWETVKQLLSDVRRLEFAPRSINRVAIASSKVLPNHLPVWVLSFWDRLCEAYGTFLSWRKCLDWMDVPCGQRPANRHRVFMELGSLIDQIRWSGHLDGKRRDRCVGDIVALLSDGELDSGQINDLLELLEGQLTEVSGNQYLIAPSELSTLIRYSYQNHRNLAYQKQKWQQSVEEELVQRHRSAVASIAWISVSGRGHWVPYAVSPVTSTIFYGDSLGLPIPEDLHDALQWWLCDLRGRLGEALNAPKLKPITITYQTDGFSCGILATNSLLHHLLPQKFPLVRGDSSSLKTYRIERTVEILKLGIKTVGLRDHCAQNLLILVYARQQIKPIKRSHQKHHRYGHLILPYFPVHYPPPLSQPLNQHCHHRFR